MLCRKCKTAVMHKSQKCGYCGANIDKYRTAKATCVICSLIGSVIGVLYFSPLAMPAEPELLSETPAVASTNISVAPNDRPLLIPAFELRTAVELEDVLISAAASAERYMAESPSAVYITNRGYLYDYTHGEYMTSAMPDTDLSDEFSLLYLLTSDLADMPELNISHSDGLVVFAAYELKDGFLMQSHKNGGGVLPREDLRRILARYETANGRIRKITARESEDIIEVLKLYSGYEAVDVRHLYRDDKYAVAYISPKEDSTDISAYILQAGDDWSIIYTDFELSSNIIPTINTALVDFDPALLPNWDLAAFSGELLNDYPECIDMMRESETISEYDEIVFQCGTKDFCFIETGSGQRFIAFLNDMKPFALFEITSYEEAVRSLSGHPDTAPIFILTQF